MGVFRDTGVVVTAAGLCATHCGERPSGERKCFVNSPQEQLHVHCLSATSKECYLLLVLRGLAVSSV